MLYAICPLEGRMSQNVADSFNISYIVLCSH